MLNTTKTFLLLAVLTVLIMLVGSAIGGRGGLMIAFLFAVLMNVGSYWYSDKIVLRMYHAQEIGPREAPELYDMVRRLAQRAGLPMPRLYLIPQEGANAFATGRDPEHAVIAVTDGLLRLLSPAEIEGVLAHELTHVRHRDILIASVAATLAGVIMMLANMAQWAAIFGGVGRDDEEEGRNPLALLFVAILAPFAAMIVQMAISRSREYLADDGAARLTRNPEGLAAALEKLHVASRRFPMGANPGTENLFIVSPLRGSGLLTLLSTHPPIEERIARLRANRSALVGTA
ncbi:MAG: zinc metalloprotease HtpX [Candidatus Tectomicrobia bacterium]|nr:zinc metalloprotease HtpX [Candidatus Tectomicrobia bacterium]